MTHLGVRSFQRSQRLAPTRRHIVLLGVLVISLVLGVAGQVAFATSHQQAVNGCYDTNSGILRHIGTGTCRSNEVALSWPSMDDFLALEATLAQEKAEREAAISALEASVAELQASVGEELDALKAADDALRSALANETTTRETSDAALQTALTDAVAELQTALDAEIAARADGDVLTLSNASAYTDEKFDASIEHTDAVVANETYWRKLGDAELLEKVVLIIDKMFPEIREALMAAKASLEQQLATVASYIQGEIDQWVANFNDTIQGIQDFLNWLWCNFFSDDC